MQARQHEAPLRASRLRTRPLVVAPAPGPTALGKIWVSF